MIGLSDEQVDLLDKCWELYEPRSIDELAKDDWVEIHIMAKSPMDLPLWQAVNKYLEEK